MNSQAETERMSRDIPANPKVPCHGCGTEERFMEMKQSDDWHLEYVDDGMEWIAHCDDCFQVWKLLDEDPGSHWNRGDVC